MKTILIGALLVEEERNQLLDFLRANFDVFAWMVLDMMGIPPEAITHKQNIDPKYRPICQKKRSFMLERQKAINKEVGKLLATGFIQEVYYPIGSRMWSCSGGPMRSG